MKKRRIKQYPILKSLYGSESTKIKNYGNILKIIFWPQSKIGKLLLIGTAYHTYRTISFDNLTASVS
jgi:hypothetical protein